MHTRDTPAKPILHIKQGGIRIGDFGRAIEQRFRLAASPVALDFLEKLYSSLRPYGPMAQQAAGEMQRLIPEPEIGQQIANNVVVIPSVERYLRGRCRPRPGSRPASDSG